MQSESIHKVLTVGLQTINFFLGNVINILLICVIVRNKFPRSQFNRRMLITRALSDLSLVWVIVPVAIVDLLVLSLAKVSLELYAVSVFLGLFLVAIDNFTLVAICLNRSMALSCVTKPSSDSAHGTANGGRINLYMRIVVIISGLIALVLPIPS
ncbi:hypothetical protein Ciccas_009370, partial [Cichlidogyrus casuarinus]